jgi:hypothetical protein
VRSVLENLKKVDLDKETLEKMGVQGKYSAQDKKFV